MQWDTWYDLSVRELSEMTDPATERLTEAEDNASVDSEPDSGDGEDEAAAPAARAPSPPAFRSSVDKLLTPF